MAKINVKKIVETDDEQAALVALKQARQYAVNGDIIPLMDLLVPESARQYEVHDSKKGTTRVIRS